MKHLMTKEALNRYIENIDFCIASIYRNALIGNDVSEFWKSQLKIACREYVEACERELK